MQNVSHPHLEADLVAAGLNAAIDQAGKQSCAIVVAIVDVSGLLSGLVRMPSAFLASNDYAEWKAWTAVSFSMATSDFAGLLRDLGDDTKAGLLAHPKVTALSGGLPIHANGQMIGAVGISGGSADQDTACAQAAVSAIVAHINR